MRLPDSMRAMVFEKVGQPLLYKQVPVPKPNETQVLIKLIACGSWAG